MARRRFGRKKSSGRRYFRRAASRRSRRSKTIPIAATAGATVAAFTAWNHYQTNWKDKPFADYIKYGAVGVLTGYDGRYPTDKWNADRMIVGKPLLAGILVSALAGKVPIVRTIPRKIPLIGRYLRW